MGALKKTLAVLVIIALVYFGAKQFGVSFLDNAAKIRAIDSEFGVGKEKLSPTTAAEIGKYVLELKMLNPYSDDEKSTIGMKIEIAQMQKSLLVLSENYPSINFANPECSVAGPLGSADAAAANALVHARKALELQAKLVNDDPFGKGWIAKVKIVDEKQLSQLMSKEQYDKYLETVKH